MAELKKDPTYTSVKVDKKKKVPLVFLISMLSVTDILYMFSQPLVSPKGVCLEDDLQFSTADDFLESHHECCANLLSPQQPQKRFPNTSPRKQEILFSCQMATPEPGAPLTNHSEDYWSWNEFVAAYLPFFHLRLHWTYLPKVCFTDFVKSQVPSARHGC